MPDVTRVLSAIEAGDPIAAEGQDRHRRLTTLGTPADLPLVNHRPYPLTIAVRA